MQIRTRFAPSPTGFVHVGSTSSHQGRDTAENIIRIIPLVCKNLIIKLLSDFHRLDMKHLKIIYLTI